MPILSDHPSFTVGLGTKQIYYKAGRLFVSFTSAFTSQDGASDAPVWAEVRPQLSTQAAHSPQWVNGALVTQASALKKKAGAYSYYDNEKLGSRIWYLSCLCR